MKKTVSTVGHLKPQDIDWLASPAKMRKMSEVTLLAYLDIVAQVQRRLTDMANTAFTYKAYEALTGEETNAIITKCQNMMTEYGSAHELLVTEVNKRFKNDMNVTKHSMDIDSMIYHMGEKYPALKEDQEAVKKRFDEKEQARLLAEQEAKKGKVKSLKETK